MILQVGADTWQVVCHGHTFVMQTLRVANARELQDVSRANAAGA